MSYDYDFDQYGYQEFDDDQGSEEEGYISSQDDSDGSKGRSDDGLEFAIGPSDWNRVGGGDELDVKTGGKMDPRDQAKAEFRQAFLNCSTRKDDLVKIIEKINTLVDLPILNMQLLALAACFHILNGEIDKVSVTNFIHDRCKEQNPLDVIRYIRYYGTL